MNLDPTSTSRLNRLGLQVPRLLLPRADIDLRRWAVIACDQFTSDHAYWERVENLVGDAPSTLRLTLPEVFLESPDLPTRTERIHAAMEEMVTHGVFEDQGEAFVFVRRDTEPSGQRDGLVVTVDLDRYDYSANSSSLVRATEGTIVDRIPPRLAVRRGALLELPHIMILIDDPECTVIEELGSAMEGRAPTYDVDLMEGGGRLRGWRVSEPSLIEPLLARLESLLDRTIAMQGPEPLFWAMGDGNHSLATAKATWEETRNRLRSNGVVEEEIAQHPARFALAEVVNIHSSGLLFEPIHRALFVNDVHALAEAVGVDPGITVGRIDEADLQELLQSADGQDKAGFFDGTTWKVLAWPGEKALPTALVDRMFERFRAANPGARIDFIHGWDDARSLAGPGTGVFFTPVIARDRLFDWVQRNGPLPRKSFSMGHAQEKRYYMEARRIVL